MKKYICLCLLLIVSKLFAQNKEVVVVMDKSGSMTGERYLSANYASQLIVGLLDPKDGFTIIDPDPAVVSKYTLAQKEIAISTIQQMPCNGGDDFEGVLKGMEILSQSSKTERWLIIFADGEWEIEADAEAIFKESLDKNGIHLIFLNVGSSVSDLAVFCQRHPSVEVIQSPNNAVAIRENLEKIASRIIATDFKGLSVSYAQNQLMVKSKFPLRKLIFIEQDAKKADLLPQPLTVTCNGAKEILEKPLMVSNFEVDGAKGNEKALISGEISHLYHNNKGDVFEANSPIVINIANADLTKIKLYPVVALQLGVTPEATFKSFSGNKYTICDDQSTVKVSALISDFFGKKLTISELVGSDFVLKSNGREIKMRLEADKFVAELPLNATITNFSVSASYPEYFNLTSVVYTVSKVSCASAASIVKLPREEPGMNMDFSTMTTEELKNKTKSMIITPTLSDVDAKGNVSNRRFVSADMYKIDFESEGGISFDIKSSMGKWVITPYTNSFCECFTYKETYEGKITMSDSAGTALTKSRWKIRVRDILPWYLRCKWIIISCFLSLFLLWFMYRIITRPRFPRKAIIKLIKVDNELGGEPNEKVFKLRNNLLKRYFMPFSAETYTVGGIKFIANSKNSIYISGKSLQENMRLGTVKLMKNSPNRLMQQNAKLLVSNPPKEDTYIFVIQNKNQRDKK